MNTHFLILTLKASQRRRLSVLLADITVQREDNYCGRAICPGLNDSPAHVRAINPQGSGGRWPQEHAIPHSSIAAML